MDCYQFLSDGLGIAEKRSDQNSVVYQHFCGILSHLGLCTINE